LLRCHVSGAYQIAEKLKIDTRSNTSKDRGNKDVTNRDIVEVSIDEEDKPHITLH